MCPRLGVLGLGLGVALNCSLATLVRFLMNSLNKRAFGGLLVLLLVMAALLFVPVGTLDYCQAWAFLAVFGSSAVAITLYLMKKDPTLWNNVCTADPRLRRKNAKRSFKPSRLANSLRC